jgi:uncharacterized protein (DUF58 family)
MEVLDGNDRGRLNTALRWHEAAYFRWRLMAGRRGIYRIGPAQTVAGDLFGFFPWSRESEAGAELVVYPRLVAVRPLELAKRDFFGAPAAGSPVEDPVYLQGTRDYEPGRPARFIHWRASARHQRYQEKVFEPSAQSKVVLILETAGFVNRPDPDGFEQAIEALASLAVHFHRQGLQVDLVTDALSAGKATDERAVSGSEMPLVSLLDRLARVQLRTDRPLLQGLMEQSHRLRRANVVYFSHQFDRSAAEAKALFKHHMAPVTFVVGRRESADVDVAAPGKEPIHLLSDISPEAGA